MFTVSVLHPPSSKHTLRRIQDAEAKCYGFCIPDLEKLLDHKNIRQHLQSLPPNSSTKIPGEKASFVSVQGVLKLLDKIKSKSGQDFKTWFLQTVLEGKDPELFSNFEGQEASMGDGFGKKRKKRASEQDGSPPLKKQKTSDVKFCDRVFVSADKVHGLVDACDQLCQKIINLPSVLETQRTFLDERNKDLKTKARHMQEHVPKICLVGEPGSGKSVAANKFALMPKSDKIDEWGKLPLDNRFIQNKVTSVTCFNYHLVRNNSPDFTIYAVTCSMDAYMARGGRSGEGLVFVIAEQLHTLQFGQPTPLRRLKTLEEVSNFTRFFTYSAMPKDIIVAIDHIEIQGPWDIPEKLVLVDTMGIAESSSLQASLVKQEINTADMLLIPNPTLLTAESLKFLERQGVFNNPARGLPAIAIVTKQDGEMTIEAEEEKQIEMIMAAASDAELLADYDPIMRLSLLGDIAARVMIIHPESMLNSINARNALFLKVLDAVRVNEVRVIVRGACSLLFAINVMSTANGKTSRATIGRELSVYQSKLNEDFDPSIEEELQELTKRLEKQAQAYYKKNPMERESRSLVIDSMNSLCLQKTVTLLRKIRSRGETLLKRYLQDLMRKIGSDQNDDPLLNFSITQMDATYSKSCVIPIHQNELTNMNLKDLLSSWLNHRNEADLVQLVQSIGDKVKSFDIPNICKASFRQVCEQISASLAKEISLPAEIIDKTKSLVKEWRTILLDWYQTANYQFKKLAKGLSRQSAENPLTGLFGNEHRTVMDSLVNEIYDKVKDGPKFEGEVLQISRVETKNTENDVVSFERDAESGKVTMVLSTRVQGLLEGIAKNMQMDHGKGGLCLFVPSKSFNEHGFRVHQKRIDFECLEGGIQHLIILVVEESQLDRYKEHFKKVSERCLPSKLEVIFSVVPDDSDIDLYFETVRLIATQFKIPYIIRVPDNVEAFYEFKLLVLRLRQCTPARALVWTQSFLIELETELWRKSLEVVSKNDKLLIFAMRRMSIDDATTYVNVFKVLLQLNLERDQGKLAISNLETLVHLLQKDPDVNDGFPEERLSELKDVTSQLAQQLAVLQSLLAISCKVAIDTYRHNFKKWPMYAGILPPRGFAIQGPVIYRTDALYHISFCSPQDFLNGKKMPVNLGEVRTKKGTTKINPKTTLRPTKWIDYYKQREQHITKILRDGGFIQLQNYLFTWTPKTTFSKGSDIEVMKRAPENDNDEPINTQLTTGSLIALSSSFTAPAMQAFSSLESTKESLKRKGLRVEDNLGGGDCMLYALLDYLKEMFAYEGDCNDLRAEVATYVTNNWRELAAYDELSLYFDTEDNAREWKRTHQTPKAWCGSEFAKVVALMFGVNLVYYITTEFGELQDMKFSPHGENNNGIIMLAYVNQNHWLSVWPEEQKKGTESDSDDLLSFESDIIVSY